MAWHEANIRPAIEAAIEAEMESRKTSPLYYRTNIKNPYTLFNHLTQRPEFEELYRRVLDHEDPVAEAQKNNTTPSSLLRGGAHEMGFAITYAAQIEEASGQRLVAIRGRERMETFGTELAWARLENTPTSAAAARVLEGKFYDPDILIIDTETQSVAESDEISTNPFGRYIGRKREKMVQARLEFPEAYNRTKLVFGIPAEHVMPMLNQQVHIETAPYTETQFDEWLANVAQYYAPEGLRPLIETHPALAEDIKRTAEKSARKPQRKSGQRKLRRAFAIR